MVPRKWSENTGCQSPPGPAGPSGNPVVPGWATATPLGAPGPVLKAANAPNNERATTAEASARRSGFLVIALGPAAGRHRQPPIGALATPSFATTPDPGRSVRLCPGAI